MFFWGGFEGLISLAAERPRSLGRPRWKSSPAVDRNVRFPLSSIGDPDLEGAARC